MFNHAVLTLTQNMGPQVIRIHPVILFNEQELILCDAGFPNQMDQIKEELKKYDFTIQDITQIVITHQDHDHIGSLHEIKKQNKNAQILSSSIEAPFIDGSQESLRLLQAEEYNKTLSGKERDFGIQFANYLKTIRNCAIDKVLQDGDSIIPGLRVVSTPGHTPGHMSLFLEDGNVFISGDALAIEDHKFMIPNPQFTLDIKLCKESIGKIRDLDPHKVICYHGGVQENHVKELLRDLLLE